MSSAISDFAKSFFYDQRGIILPLVLIIPAAIEVIKFIGNVIERPEIVKEKFESAKQLVVTSFTRSESETEEDFRYRLVKNILLVISGGLLMGCAAAFPFVVLPLAWAIPVAIVSIYATGLLLSKLNKVPDLANKIVDAFTRQKDETDEEWNKRLLINSVKAVFAVAAIAAVAFATYQLALIVIGVLGAASGGAYGVNHLLPGQTTVVVFIEYLLIGVLHLILAARCFYKEEYAKGIFHLIGGVASVIFPVIGFLENPAGVRLHHSFTGLLFMLMPLTCLQILGSIIAFDSSLYWVADPRGHAVGRSFDQFDFMNIVVPNLTLFVTVFTAISLFQLVTEELTASEKAPKVASETA